MDIFHSRRDLAAIVRRRSFQQEAEMALSALGCVAHGELVTYASSELTTGRRFYRLLGEHGVRDGQELRQRLGEDGYHRLLWQPNADAANAFARSLQHRLGESVVSPAPFQAPGWSQPEYLAFWEQLIRTRAHAVYFNEGWQFSNGCTYELSVALDAGVATFDAAGAPLAPAAAVAEIAAAIAELEATGFAPTTLATHLQALRHLSGI